MLIDFFHWLENLCGSKGAQAILSALGLLGYAIAVFSFIRNWMNPYKKMIGRWEGDIKNVTDDLPLSQCILIITPCPNRNYKAIFYYENNDSRNRFKGMDVLDDCDPKDFFRTRKWEAEFHRKFHLNYYRENSNHNDYDEYREDHNEKRVIYKWDCVLIGSRNGTKIKAKITGNKEVYEGTFHKS